MTTLQQLQQVILRDLEAIINYAEKNNLTNSQEFLNFLDKLNEISIRY